MTDQPTPEDRLAVDLEQSLRAFAIAASRREFDRALAWANIAAALVEADSSLVEEGS
jgi:hypothetical protein